jgi:hypothetical protein
MTELPAPLVPAEVDLSDFPFMPLMIARLKQSRAWLICKRRPEMAFYLINLWTASWHNRPAASLEDDDLVLADLAMCSDEVWTRVRADALRGWVKCSDGRLYHPVIAEQAMAAWERKVAQRNRTAAATAARAAKHAERHDDGINKCDDDGPKERDDDRNVNPDEQRDDDRNVHQGTGTGTVKGIEKETRERISDGLPSQKPAKEKTPRKHPFPADAFDSWYAGYPNRVGKGAAQKAFAKVMASDTVAFEKLVKALADYVRTKPPDRPWCNPATWLNEGRWADEPAPSLIATPPPRGEPGSRIDFGNGCSAAINTIRNMWSTGKWPSDWGAPPGQPGCRIPSETIAKIMGERAA